MRPAPIMFMFAGLCGAALVACGDGRDGVSSCAVGETRACSCADGVSMGQQVCQGGGVYSACTPCGPMVQGDQYTQYVVSSLTLPAHQTEYAYDLDGDGVADNRLGAIIESIGALELMPQANVDMGIASGMLSLLLEQLSTDPIQQNATNAGLQMTRGMKTATPPRFDGTDTFVPDPSTKGGQFVGDIVMGTYTSQDPASAAAPIELSLALPLVDGKMPLALPITAARITFYRNGEGHLVDGRLNGAIRKTDVDAIILPGVADLVTMQLAIPGHNPGLDSFDTDGNGVVTAVELSNNDLIKILLAPDVSIFGGVGGSFDPNPGAPEKDCLSLGVKFEAVHAIF